MHGEDIGRAGHARMDWGRLSVEQRWPLADLGVTPPHYLLGYPVMGRPAFGVGVISPRRSHGLKVVSSAPEALRAR